ncbi:MAG: DUF2791 family P-loop domain-containing protein [Chloroflexi bacterium]|nr:DUF2791 family P-loop domain-containing protein [Chloroflexota bacterium]
MGLTQADWLEIVERDYLADYVRHGGAAVKFALSADQDGRDRLRAGLQAAADRQECRFAFSDARRTKTQMIDRLFHEIARQIDWDDLARRYLATLLAEAGYRLPEEPDGLHIARLARLNELPEQQLRLDVTRLLWNRLLRDYEMSQEFRLAMIKLCSAQLDPADEPSVIAATREWLTGELRQISSLKRALIFQKIVRANARHMLVSLTHWLRIAGARGLVLVMDIERCALAVPVAQRDSSVYYSANAAWDTYEVLRQLIDGADDLESTLIVVLAGAQFASDSRRGLEGYRALYYRVADDVRDRYRQNPLGALVRLPTSDGATVA